MLVDVSTLDIRIVRWERLENGYVGFRVEDFGGDGLFKGLVDVANRYLLAKLKVTLSPSNFQYKTIPGYSKYFRLIYSQPFPFILSLDQP